MNGAGQDLLNIGEKYRGDFLIPKALADQYPERTFLSKGGYGIVYGLESPTAKDLAVKKFLVPFESPSKAKRCFRELQLIANLNHKNIIKMKCMYTTKAELPEPYAVYLVTEYAGPDLRMWIQKETDAGQQFSLRCIKKWISELLRALKYLSSAKVIHRDLTPDNLAISFTGTLTVLDFGVSRAFVKGNDLTSDPGTRYYRALESMTNFTFGEDERLDNRPRRKRKYDETADMWSVGAILCEMLTGEILFKTYAPPPTRDNPVVKAIEVCGPIPECVLRKIDDHQCQTYCREKSVKSANEKAAQGKSLRWDFLEYFRQKARSWLKDEIAREGPALLNFIDRTLNFNPRKRLSIDAALRHPFLSVARVASEEVVAPHTIQDEGDRTLDQWQQRIWEFIHTQIARDQRSKRKVLVGVRAKKQSTRKSGRKSKRG